MTIAVVDACETLDAHIAFHLNAGVDHVLVTASNPQGDTMEILESYERAGYLSRVSAEGVGADHAHTGMARRAVAEHGADWVVPSTPTEFWWPRGESLKDVLAVIPPRYAIVQALVRSFVGHRGEGFFADELTARTSLLAGNLRPVATPRDMLRPVYRAEPNFELDADDWTLRGRRVPLRAWYPIEVLQFPEATAAAGEGSVEERIAAGEFVVDVRLRDALRGLREEQVDTFSVPAAGASLIAFPVPSIVDDASYAIECAAVGEVDLVRLDQHIRELEHRIAALEARFWPSVRRTLRRLARRPS